MIGGGEMRKKRRKCLNRCYFGRKGRDRPSWKTQRVCARRTRDGQICLHKRNLGENTATQQRAELFCEAGACYCPLKRGTWKDVGVLARVCYVQTGDARVMRCTGDTQSRGARMAGEMRITKCKLGAKICGSATPAVELCRTMIV